MIIPPTPSVSELDSISPSTYEAAIVCAAKAVWSAKGDRSVLPDHPAAVLGRAFHAVIATAHRGHFELDGRQAIDTARELFDQSVSNLYDAAHPLLREKFRSIERLPYFNLHRERCALYASKVAEERGSNAGASSEGTSSTGFRPTETWLSSADGLVVGRPDYVEVGNRAVVDYKTGVAADPTTNTPSDSEARQLRLYAHLCRENEVEIATGVIIRGNGSRCDLAISREDAEEENRLVRLALASVNSSIQEGKGFADLASPSSANCAYCPCIPFCEAFWERVEPEWVDEESSVNHVEGRVTSVSRTEAQGTSVVTIELDIDRGTIEAQSGVIEQVPESWVLLGDDRLPEPGDTVRAVYCRRTDGEIATLRLDRIATSVWRREAEE